MRTTTADGRQPNILFIMADQFRADALGCVNGWTRTPNLDNLAGQGVLFTETFDNSAECVPARFSLATGLYPHQTGVWRNDRYTLNPLCPNWMRSIEQAGYQTSLVGKTHLHPHEGDLRERLPLMNAYGLQTVDEITGPHAALHARSNMTDWWEAHRVLDAFRSDLANRVANKRHVVRPSPLGLDFHYDVYVGQRACRLLRELGTGGRPWFFWVSFAGPHEPWDAPEPYASMYDPGAAPPPVRRIEGIERGLVRNAFESSHYSPRLAAEEVAQMRANYAGNVTLIDDQIGAILDVVESREELDETLVVFTSDHGEMNGDHQLVYKANFLDPVIRLPLIIRPPASCGGIRGRKTRAMTELIDVGATLADYAGGPPVSQSHGRTLRPLIEGREMAGRPYAVSEFDGHLALISSLWKIELAPDDVPSMLIDRAGSQEQRNAVDDDDRRSDIAMLTAMIRSFRASTPTPPVRAAL